MTETPHTTPTPRHALPERAIIREPRTTILTRILATHRGWEVSETDRGRYQAVRRNEDGTKTIVRSTLVRLESALDRLAEQGERGDT